MAAFVTVFLKCVGGKYVTEMNEKESICSVWESIYHRRFCSFFNTEKRTVNTGDLRQKYNKKRKVKHGKIPVGSLHIVFHCVFLCILGHHWWWFKSSSRKIKWCKAHHLWTLEQWIWWMKCQKKTYLPECTVNSDVWIKICGCFSRLWLNPWALVKYNLHVSSYKDILDNCTLLSVLVA